MERGALGRTLGRSRQLAVGSVGEPFASRLPQQLGGKLKPDMSLWVGRYGLHDSFKVAEVKYVPQGAVLVLADTG